MPLNGFPLIVVSYKSNDDVRLCVDLREINKAVIPDVYPILPIQELLCELHDAKIFSQLDMEGAYHQLELHPNSRDLTALQAFAKTQCPVKSQKM